MASLQQNGTHPQSGSGSAAGPEPASATPFEIRCAEIWGGVSVREDAVSTPGIHAAIHSSASGDAKGGDLYYFSVCAYDALTRVAVADVRGHGEAVSHLSEWLYRALEARMNDEDGAAVLADLNQMVCRRGFEGITTAFVATFHRDRGVLHYASAGHPPAMMLRQSVDGDDVAAARGWHVLPDEAAGNLPLGILPSAEYRQQKVKVQPGDRLFVYSDGVSECPSVIGGEDMYGDARLRAALVATQGLTLPDARLFLREDLEAYAGGGPLLHDDCTFLLFEVRKPALIWKRRIFPGRPGMRNPRY